MELPSMHIILTHEQADFDALASLLGAHLLDEDAVPRLSCDGASHARYRR